MEFQNTPKRGRIFYYHRACPFEALLRGRLHYQRRWKRTEDYTEKGAFPSVFQWSSEKRSRSTLASKGKRRGEALEAPHKKRRRKSCQHCERKRAVIDKLQTDVQEKIHS